MRLEPLYSAKEVKRFVGMSVPTMYARMKLGTFPPPVRIGTNSVAWRESDLRDWQATLESGVNPEVSAASVAKRRQLREEAELKKAKTKKVKKAKRQTAASR